MAWVQRVVAKRGVPGGGRRGNALWQRHEHSLQSCTGAPPIHGPARPAAAEVVELCYIFTGGFVELHRTGNALARPGAKHKARKPSNASSRALATRLGVPYRRARCLWPQPAECLPPGARRGTLRAAVKGRARLRRSGRSRQARRPGGSARTAASLRLPPRCRRRQWHHCRRPRPSGLPQLRSRGSRRAPPRPSRSSCTTAAAGSPSAC
jgi:hypothetical protein